MNQSFQEIVREHDLSTLEIAALLNVRADTVRHWLSGRRDVSDNIVNELSLALDNANASLGSVKTTLDSMERA